MTGCKKQDPPTVSTSGISEITINSVKAGGSVLSDGGAEVTSRGVCWSTAQQPTNADNLTSDGSGTGDFNSTLTGLEEGTTYYLRAYATNSEGTSYGEEVSFTTIATSIATITTAAVTSITTISGVTGGNITNDGLLTITARGVAWATSQNPTVEGNHTADGTGAGEFTSNLTGLVDGTVYYVRAYATNSKGTAYGNEVSFTTAAAAPATLTTAAVSDLTSAGLVSGGNISNDGGVAVTARGIVWNTSPNPTLEHFKSSDGTGSGAFVSTITGLSNGTVYYIRSYATNKAGTAYGNEISVITPVTDVEGNVYKTVKIGNQVWMAENLKTTKYRNNTAIPQVTDSVIWMSLTTPAYTWYRNNVANKPLGALYTWYTIATNNLCPDGWHVPT